MDIEIKKTLYLVRHGESVANRDKVIQGMSDPLTERGQKQAEVVAERVSHLTIDLLCSSDMARAVSTAKAIEQKIGVAPMTSPLFREKQAASIKEGGILDIDAFFNQIQSDDFDKKEDNEETFSELLERVTQAVAFIESREEENILVVTHGNFLKAFTTYLLLGKDCTPKNVATSIMTYKTTNTGITTFRQRSFGWQLLTWNDHAHFAE